MKKPIVHWFYQPIQENVMESQLFMQLKDSKTQDLTSDDEYLVWTQVCQRYSWSSNKEKNLEDL